MRDLKLDQVLEAQGESQLRLVTRTIQKVSATPYSGLLARDEWLECTFQAPGGVRSLPRPLHDLLQHLPRIPPLSDPVRLRCSSQTLFGSSLRPLAFQNGALRSPSAYPAPPFCLQPGR